MKIDWTKVKEGFTYQDVLKAENKELKERIKKVIADMEDTRDRNVFYEDSVVDVSILTFWIDILKGEDKE